MLAKKCFLMGIFILLSVSLAIADPPAVHPTTGEPLVIDCLRGTPDAIDGDLSDWNLEVMIPAILNVEEQLFQGQVSWDGPEDCSGEFYLLWDDVNIYMAVVVKDDVLSMNKSGGNIWNADCVEIFFSTTNAVAGHDEHYQYGFDFKEQTWNWCNMDGSGGRKPDYLQVASTETADGYICEAAIPYGQMPSLDFSVGNIIGFHPVLDDTDNGNRELQMTWTGRTAHDQSFGFGHIVLSDALESPDAIYKQMCDLYTLAVETGDVDLYVNNYMDNAVQIPPDVPTRIGSEQIRAAIEPVLAQFNVVCPIYPQEAKIIDNWAFGWCDWSLSLTPKEGGETTTYDGKGIDILKRQADGSWRYYMSCWNYNGPPTVE
jgi:ketosteroid isomerase-like protein